MASDLSARLSRYAERQRFPQLGQRAGSGPTPVTSWPHSAQRRFGTPSGFFTVSRRKSFCHQSRPRFWSAMASGDSTPLPSKGDSRQQDADLLAAARNAFPELRRRAGASQPPRVEPVASANVAGEGESSGGASHSSAAHRAGWYRRVNGSPVVKDAGPTRVSAWQNYEPPNRGEPPQHFVDTLESGPAPFPAGLNVRD